MKPRSAFSISLAASFVVLGAVGSIAPASAAPAGTTTVMNCAGKGVAKPASITITCADAGVSVDKITWSAWRPDEAIGKGVLSWNTCLPENCAAGITQTYPVNIRLGGLAHAPKSLVFSKMTLGFPQGGPAALNSGTYNLDNESR